MRKLAHVEKIIAIDPIENADRIEVATVLGWKVVIKKGEFKVGDAIVYIEVDSSVPNDNPYFEFLQDRKFKVKSIKLRKQISQGLICPISILPDGDYEYGDDVTDILKIKKIEEDYKQYTVDVDARLKHKHKKLYNNKCFKAMMKFEWFRQLAYRYLLPKKKNKKWLEWVIKTDEERVQNIPWVLNNKDPFIVTEKIDGTSTTFTMKKNKRKWDFYVCSRNVVQDSQDKQCYFKEIGNVYWEMADKYNVESALRQIINNENIKDYITIQAETYGEGVQGNKYGITGRRMKAFNLIIDDKKINSVMAIEMLDEYGIPFVPIINDQYILPDTIDELMSYSTGNSLLYDTLREGYVFRNYKHNISFKCVSNDFLLKWKI